MSNDDTPEKMELTSMDLAAQKRQELRQLLPEVFAEDRVDFEQLRRVMGDWVEPGRERFGLNWPGKAECMKIIQQPSVATLKPVRDESINFDETENLFIEGDNLEVLKLLQKAYFGKVKMIYIDPPYNTGKEFIYPDKYQENLDTYLAYTSQVDSNGHKFSTNTEKQGRYHSNWLNMMYPRLYLAKNLLREDGVIFISIDDNEQANLKALCDLVFGEENFAVSIPWQSRLSIQNDTDFSCNNEYILVYARNRRVENRRLKQSNEDAWHKKDSFVFKPLPLDKNKFDNSDNDVRGLWKADPFDAPNVRPNLTYPITNPNTGEQHLPPIGRCWRMSYLQFSSALADNRIAWGKNGVGRPQLKVFYEEKKHYGSVDNNWFHGKRAGTTTMATKELQDLLGNTLFDTPKPTKLLKQLLSIGFVENNDIILDFFAGSATTAHAVMQLNAEDGGNRKFICVQLPEPCAEKSEAQKAGFKTIADIGRERIRRAGKKLLSEASTQLDLEDGGKPDIGFRAFRLDRSNFNIWQADANKIEDLEKQLDLHVDHLNRASSPEDILYELLLKAGSPLTTKVEKHTMAGKDVYAVADGTLLICLDREITPELIEALAEARPLQVICLDKGFRGNDQLKTNAVQSFKSRAESRESETVFKTV